MRIAARLNTRQYSIYYVYLAAVRFRMIESVPSSTFNMKFKKKVNKMGCAQEQTPGSTQI